MNLDWRHRLLEAGAIFVSILLAFAIDAWWEEQQEREREAEVLHDLAEELRGNIEDARISFNEGRGWLAVQARTRNATAELLEQIYGLEPAFAAEFGDDKWPSVEDVFDFERSLHSRETASEATMSLTQLHWLTTANTWGPRIGTLDLLIQSGALLDLEDEKLRNQLTQLPAILADVNDEEQEQRMLIEAEVLPALRTAGLPPSAYRFPMAGVSEAIIEARDIEPIPDRTFTLTITPELVHAASRMHMQADFQYFEMEMLVQRFESIVTLIEKRVD